MNDQDTTKGKTSKVLNISTYWLLFFFFVFGCNSNDQEDRQVFVTETGSKFHQEHCRYLKYSRKIISLKEAEEKGYGPCKVCKPKEGTTDPNTLYETTHNTSIPAKPLQYAIRCSHKNDNGIQCKRMTKNAGGKCWQHKSG